jgi:peptidoglycan/LPS O-acetylase OafA/YrhL
MIQRNKVYFENLNSIRFIAASLVIFNHIEHFKNLFHISNHYESINIIGKLGVVLFFVLSGFLISYLLFKEKEVTNTISIKSFYIRRILRIWPLYFLIVFLTFFIFPFVSFLTIEGFDKTFLWTDLFYKLILYITFLPNLVLAIYGIMPFVDITWSIGVEEQFYLIWPILNKKIKNKWLIMASVILIYLIIKRYIYYLPKNIHDIIENFWTMTPIDCMAIGGVFALLLYDNHKYVSKIRNFLYLKIVQWVTLILTIFLISIGYKLPGFYYESYAILFGILILNFASNPNKIFSMENRVLNYLGKISYGLYMYHSILIVISIQICRFYNTQNDYIIYPLSFILTILVASFSYNFFEKRFIDKKIQYTKIMSGDNARD